MPRQRKYRILEDFDYSPRSNVVMAFKAGDVKTGLTKDCLLKAGCKVEEIGEAPAPE